MITVICVINYNKEHKERLLPAQAIKYIKSIEKIKIKSEASVFSSSRKELTLVRCIIQDFLGIKSSLITPDSIFGLFSFCVFLQ